MTDPLLVVEDVVVRYGGLLAVDRAGFEMRQGSLTALIGPNGAGKSTLFNAITGFARKAGGKVTFEGRSILGLQSHQIARAGLVRTFQVTKVFEAMSVLDNLLVATPDHPGERFGVAWLRRRAVQARETENLARAQEILEIFTLTEVADHYAGELSGGQRKLLELARALMMDPKAVLLDEPMAGVNPVLRRLLLDHIQRIRLEHGMTFLIVEHDMDAVMRHADHIVVMAQGRVIFAGTPAEVRESPMVIEAYLGADRGSRRRRGE